MIHYPNIYHLICPGAWKKFHKIMQQLFFNEISRYIKIHGSLSPPYFFTFNLDLSPMDAGRKLNIFWMFYV